MKNILLIEDEIHKRDELSNYLREFRSEADIESVESVREAVMAVSDRDFDLVILDMALPTFTAKNDAGEGGLDQAFGGVEVLRTLSSIGKRAKLIIVTQYPDITLDGKRIKLRLAKNALSKKYGQDILGVVLYKYKSSSNRSKLNGILNSVW